MRALQAALRPPALPPAVRGGERRLKPPVQEARPAPGWLLPAGLLIGFVGGLCGIGGGLFAVPLLHVARRLDLRSAIATGLVLVLATTGAATLTEWSLGAPNTRWIVLFGLLPGAFLGALWGFRVAERISAHRLKQVFVVVLLAAGARMLTTGSGEAAAAGGGALGWAACAVGFGVGIGGGFLAPLLGVGGGLLMVPGLFLGIPGLGFAGARTASLAAGAVASARSLRLHARAGRVDWRSGAALGLGAVLGAAGARLVAGRGSAWVDAGRIGLGVLLALVALRFARELWRGQA